MFNGPNAAATVRRRLQPQRKHRPALEEHLRLIARQHQVCYEIWPLWSIAEGKRGFELMLCGVNGHVSHEGNGVHAVPCCSHCAQTYSELREIVEWVLHLQKPPSGVEIRSFDRALHMAPPHRQLRKEIVITIAILHGADHIPGDDPCDSECLKEVRERLSKLGILEDISQVPA
jgi:hypothetical protein